jgi:hypothetical protein
MPYYRQLAMRPGAYETSDGRQLFLSERDLARCRDNTLRLLARGWRVPVFLGHVELQDEEGGPQLEEEPLPQGPPRLEAPRNSPRWLGRQGCSTAVGWLHDVTVEPDGSLAHVIYLQRDYLWQIKRERLRHTSPEIRPTFIAAGETLGPIIAHIALTRRPLCRGQTRLTFVRMQHQHNYFQSSASFMKGNDMTPEPTTPDISPAVEEELAAPPQPETDIAASDARPTPLDRTTLAERIRRSRKLPRGLRERLCEFVETLQFSADAQGEPVVPVAEAVSMIEAAVPEHLQLDDELEEPAHPRGEDFFRGHSSGISDEDADRIAAEQLAASGFGPTA